MTRVVLQGKAYPSSSVNILRDGQVVGVAQADTSSDFTYELTSITPGPTTFGFWATDGKGLRSVTFTTTFQVTQNAVTTVSNIFLPPTISITNPKILLGDIIELGGTTAPSARVSVHVNREQNARVTATSSTAGVWNAAFAAESLTNEAFHVAKAMFETFGVAPQAKSGFSQALSFYVGESDRRAPGSADLNNDGKVNLIDFSILLFHWNTDHAIADLNSDGRVNLTDFSILLFNWTG
jgi:hypothetical protein